MIRFGTVNCSCGQQFHVESVNDTVNCIRCAKEHNISTFPELKPIEQIESATEVEFEDIQDVELVDESQQVQEPQNGTEGA